MREIERERDGKIETEKSVYVSEREHEREGARTEGNVQITVSSVMLRRHATRDKQQKGCMVKGRFRRLLRLQF